MARDKHTSFVHGIRVATPCNADWNSMTGDERARFCHACSKHVYNISAMTSEEAEKLITEKEGNMCVRIYRRKDGTVITQDCPRGLAALHRRWLTGVAAVTALISGAAIYFLQKTPESPAKDCALQSIKSLAAEAQENATRPRYEKHARAHGGLMVAEPVQRNLWRERGQNQ